MAEGHLSRDQRHALESVLVVYADVFAETSEDVGRTSMIQHRIHTHDTAPIRQQPRRVPPARREQAQSLVHEMLKKDTHSTVQQSMGITHCTGPKEERDTEILCRLPQTQCGYSQRCLSPPKG